MDSLIDDIKQLSISRETIVKNGYVYFIRSNTFSLGCDPDCEKPKCSCKLIKIGFAKNIDKRLRGLKTSNPGVYVKHKIYTYDYPRLEKLIQKYFIDNHYELEWYFIDDCKLETFFSTFVAEKNEKSVVN